MAMTCFACTNWQIMASSMYVFHTELIMWQSSCGNVGFHIKEVCGNRWHIADWQGQQLEFPGKCPRNKGLCKDCKFVLVGL